MNEIQKIISIIKQYRPRCCEEILEEKLEEFFKHVDEGDYDYPSWTIAYSPE